MIEILFIPLTVLPTNIIETWSKGAAIRPDALIMSRHTPSLPRQIITTVLMTLPSRDALVGLSALLTVRLLNLLTVRRAQGDIEVSKFHQILLMK